jgi:putative membrane protein
MSFQELNRIVNELDICYGGHLRIRSTPLPYAYFVHLRAIIFMYIIALPFALVSFKYSTGGAGISIASQLGVAFASAYAVLGVEQSAIELERPYGVTTSCLAMETFCNAIWTSCTELLSFHTLVFTHD